jgi:molybdenum cofactor cytidylyltransferase
MTGPKLRIVVLAAGYSARLGQPKCLARIHGMTLLRRTVGLLTTLRHAGILVVAPPRCARHRVELRGRGAEVIANPRRAEGLSSSMRRGLLHARHSAAVLLLPVDLAGLTRRDLARLIARWTGARRRVVAARYGNLGGTPLILPHRYYAAAQAIVGDQGLKALINRLPKGERILMPIISGERDIDTPQDLERARRRFGAGT